MLESLGLCAATNDPAPTSLELLSNGMKGLCLWDPSHSAVGDCQERHHHAESENHQFQRRQAAVTSCTIDQGDSEKDVEWQPLALEGPTPISWDFEGKNLYNTNKVMQRTPDLHTELLRTSERELREAGEVRLYLLSVGQHRVSRAGIYFKQDHICTNCKSQEHI